MSRPLNEYNDPQLRQRVIHAATGIDYAPLEQDAGAFDYDALLASPNLSHQQVADIQAATKTGNTPLFPLPRITQMVRAIAPLGYGAHIALKDEAANASGSFKARRASLSIHEAKRRGYAGVAAATSGNYGAAVASQAAMAGLACIVVQEAFDSRFVGQPEILEKARACEAYGAEVRQLTVGPELFLTLLSVLEETGFFSASLYTPYSILGIETIGREIAAQTRTLYGRDPDAVLVSHAGGGNLTGTARGLASAGATDTALIAVSVNLQGLHMASDNDFNRKSFTTSHTGFSRPFLTRPDRVDVPRNAARPLRYLDRFVTVEQGEVFYATEMLAMLEGLERGPAGNTALAAAIPIAAELPSDHVVVVQESEYTGAGKSHHAQLTFARDQGIKVRIGDPRDNDPGRAIVLPEHPGQIAVTDVDLDKARRDVVANALTTQNMGPVDVMFLAAETRLNPEEIERIVFDMRSANSE